MTSDGGAWCQADTGLTGLLPRPPAQLPPSASTKGTQLAVLEGPATSHTLSLACMKVLTFISNG